ncbi:MAG: helix-turn-helix domain-containing protein [Flavobacterium sp.]
MKYPIYFLLLFITNTIFSQNKTVLSDSEYIILQDKVRSLINSNIDSAFIFADKMERSNNYVHKAFASGAKSYLFQRKGDSIQSKKFYRQAFNFLDKVSMSREKTKLNSYLLNFGGLIDWKNSAFSEALDKYQQGKKLSQSIEDQIQVVKFNNNIALINGEVGNYKLAISASKESDRITDGIEYLYSEDQFIRNKSNINFNLGSFYETYYVRNKSKKNLLDSAEYYYKKSINFSKNLIINKVVAQKNLGNIYYLKNDFGDAEILYQSMLMTTKENGMTSEYCNVNYNLGDLYFTLKKYNKALVFFQKVDSIYISSKINHLEYTNSNYYQAKIYDIYKNQEKALMHSKIYLDNFEKNESKLNEETLEVNSKLGNLNLKKEMDDVQKEYKNKVLLKKIASVFFAVLFVCLLVFLIKSAKEKKKTNEKINALIEEYKDNLDKSNKSLNDLLKENNIAEEVANSEYKKTINTINIDEIKENEIVEKLKNLENKFYYINSDFTQQLVAKKIKTNTTYLSYVVNKRFGKTFSEYSNELKINYAINEMISNPTYRKYSTQAIAESVGFKNAVSFTKSFSKRTGVTPVQFTKRLESEKI